MSLDTALKAIGLLVVGWILLWTFVAMGPIGWVGIGALLVLAVVTTYKKRKQADRTGRSAPSVRNCPACGSPNDAEASRCEYCSTSLESVTPE